MVTVFLVQLTTSDVFRYKHASRKDKSDVDGKVLKSEELNIRDTVFGVRSTVFEIWYLRLANNAIHDG